MERAQHLRLNGVSAKNGENPPAAVAGALPGSALAFAIHSQRNRRNLTEADIMRCIETLDKRSHHGEGQERMEGKFQPKAPDGAIGEIAQPVKSARKTADLLGISPKKVERARAVLDHAPGALKQALARGKKTINAAYNEVQAGRKPAAPPPTARRCSSTPQLPPNHLQFGPCGAAFGMRPLQ